MRLEMVWLATTGNSWLMRRVGDMFCMRNSVSGELMTSGLHCSCRGIMSGEFSSVSIELSYVSACLMRLEKRF